MKTKLEIEVTASNESEYFSVLTLIKGIDRIKVTSVLQAEHYADAQKEEAFINGHI